jgi:Family of unknown function (DUF6416)
MADKQVTVAVAEERVPEFYAWFASFLAAPPGAPPPFAGGGPRGRRSHRHHGEAQAWSAQDADQAAWLYGKLAPQARELFDLLAGTPGARFGGEDIATRLKLEKGAHGVAGILAWPGRYSRHLDRTLPIATEGRSDGGTDYYMEPELAQLFSAARASSSTAPVRRHPRPRRERSR